MAVGAVGDVLISMPDTVTGGIFVSDEGVDSPVDAKGKLNAAFRTLGLVGEDGISITEDASDDDFKVWGGVKWRKMRSEFSATASLKLHSVVNFDTLKAVFGKDNVVESGGVITIKHGSEIAPVQAFSIETKDGNFIRRYFAPRGQITVSGDRVLSHKDVDGFEVEIEFLADENKVCYYELVEKIGNSKPAVVGQ